MKKEPTPTSPTKFSGAHNRVSFASVMPKPTPWGLFTIHALFAWMELGRTEFLRQYGFSYRQCEEEGYFPPLLTATCHYHAPAKYDDLVTVETWIKTIRPPYIEFAYKITREPDGLLLVNGETKQICITKDGKPRREPVKRMETFFKELS